MKTCTKCNKEKEFSDFPRQSANKDGYANHCKDCKRATNRQWRETNIDYDKERVKKWKQENRHKVNENARQWRQANLARAREIGLRKQYKRKSLLGDKLPDNAFQTLLALYGKCLKCDSVDRLTIDHVVPLALGGANELENLQLLCLSCNSSKGHRSCADYRPAAIAGTESRLSN